MGSTLVLVFGTVAAGIFLGVLIGRLTGRSDLEQRLGEAFERGKEEAEIEKANLGAEIGEELLKLRHGIEGIVQAYDTTVRLVQDRLGTAAKHQSLGVEEPHETQLSLDFKGRSFSDTGIKGGDFKKVEFKNPQVSEESPQTLAAQLLVPQPEEDRIELETIQAESVDDLTGARESTPTFVEPNGRDKAYSLQ